MRILLCHNFYRSAAPSGEDIAYENEKKMLIEAGINVDTYEKYNDDLENIAFFDKAKLGISNSWSNTSYCEIKRKIKKFKPDLVHFHNTFPQITPSGYAACKDMSVSVVQTLHNFRLLCANALFLRDGKVCELCLSGSLYSAIRYKCYRNSLVASASQVLCISRNRWNGSYFNNVDTYIALTEFAKNKFIKAGFNSNLLKIRPNFLPNPPQYSRCNQNYAIFVGRITKEKGIMTLLESWEGRKDYQLKVIGAGELLSDCKKFVFENNLNVEFMGYLPRKETQSAIQKARFMILPSECYEGFPISLLEAYASGTPILVSNIGGQSEIVNDGITGRKFNVGSKEDLKEKCHELFEDDELVEMLSKNARQEFEQKFTQSSVLRETLKIYSSLIG